VEVSGGGRVCIASGERGKKGRSCSKGRTGGRRGGRRGGTYDRVAGTRQKTQLKKKKSWEMGESIK